MDFELDTKEYDEGTDNATGTLEMGGGQCCTSEPRTRRLDTKSVRMTLESDRQYERNRVNANNGEEGVCYSIATRQLACP